MAQAYPYLYQGRRVLKQDKCRWEGPLDKARLWLDFNELCFSDGDGPVYLFSRGDVVNDSAGRDVALYAGMAVSLFDGDLDPEGRPDPLLAEGVLLPGGLPQAPGVKWLVRLTRNRKTYRSGQDYVYWLSDLEASGAEEDDGEGAGGCF